MSDAIQPPDDTQLDDELSADVINESDLFDEQIGHDMDESVDEPEAVPSEADAGIPEPPKPEWKIKAEQLYEERQAHKQQLLEERRKYDEKRRKQREQHEQTIEEKKADADARLREQLRQREAEKQAAFSEMMERVREEKERKRREREAYEQGVALDDDKTDDDIETKQSAAGTEKSESEAPQPDRTRDDDLSNRVSRLAKPDEDGS